MLTQLARFTGWMLRASFAAILLSRSVGLPDALPDITGLALRFDAGRNPLPGAGECSWVCAARNPSYRLVQRHAGASG